MHERFTRHHRWLGRTAAWAVFFFLIAYAVTLALGLLSLESPADPIGDPYFSLLELLIFAAPVFRTGRLEKTVRVLMAASGVLSLAGLAGVALADMSIRNIGIPGYVGASLVVFPLLAVAFGRARQAPEG